MSITLLNVAARGIYLIVFLAIGNRYGSNAATDAVFLIYAPLTVVMSVFGGVADTVLMPGIHRATAGDCFSYYRHYIVRYAMLLTLALTAGALVIMLLFHLPFESAGPAILVLVPTPILATLSAIYTSLLNAGNRFHRAVLGPIYGAACAAIPLILVPGSEFGLASTLLAYEIGRALGLRVHAAGEMRRSDGRFATAGSRGLMSWTARQAFFQAVGSGLVAANPLINILFARTLGNGAISSVEYASRLWNMVPLAFVGALTLFFSESSLAAARNQFDTKRTNAVALRLGTFAVALSVALIAVSPWLIDLLYRWGPMNDDARRELSVLLSAHLIGTGPYIAGLVYVRAISAVGSIRDLTNAAAVSALALTAFDVMLVPQFGLSGIGLATSATQVGVAVYLYSRVRRLNPAHQDADQ